MADITLLLQYLRELDKKYEAEGGWGYLDENHPDIIKAQALNPFYQKEKQIGRRTILTPEKDEFIRQNYLTMTDEELSKQLKVSVSTVVGRRSKLRCRRPPVISSRKRLEAMGEDGKVIATYSSITHAAAELNVERFAITNAIKKNKPLQGHDFYLREVKTNDQ